MSTRIRIKNNGPTTIYVRDNVTYASQLAVHPEEHVFVDSEECNIIVAARPASPGTHPAMPRIAALESEVKKLTQSREKLKVIIRYLEKRE